jgi:hypothetical protein
MTTLDDIILDVPLGAKDAEGSGADAPGRRWLTPEGIYLVAGVTRGPNLMGSPSASADMLVAQILGGYIATRRGSVEIVGVVPVPGAVAARAARGTFRTVTEERYSLVLVGAYGSDGDVVVLQVMWPTIGTRILQPQVMGVLESFGIRA